MWRLPLDQPRAQLVAWERLLSDDERKRAARFRFELHRGRFIAGRAMMRILLARYAHVRPEHLVFRYGRSGKPALVASEAVAPLYFNLSHAEEQGLFAVTRVDEVGVDIERIRELAEWEQVAAFCLRRRRIARLRKVKPDLRLRLVFRAWTRHEAVLKAMGKGLGISPEPEHYSVWTFEVDNEHCATVAASKAVKRLHRFEWTATDGVIAPRETAAP